MPELYGSRKYPPEKKLEAVVVYMVKGTLKETSKFTGVPVPTLQLWKGSEWWATLMSSVKRAKQEDLDNRLTQIIHEGSDLILDRFRNGEEVFNPRTGEIKKIQMKGKDVATATAIIYDKRALLRGEATQRIERLDKGSRLDSLRKEFQKFANAKQIEGEVVSEEED